MNKTLFFSALLTVLICAVKPSFSQVKETKEKPVFFIVEEMPEFPGGEPALRQHIAVAITYPAKARDNGIEGRVYISFVVDETGSVTDAKVARGVDNSLDEEALRVVRELPKWKPGRQRGEEVKVAYTIPVNFVLSNKSSSVATGNQMKFAVAVETGRPSENLAGTVYPKFPGGDSALNAYMANNLLYPEAAAKDGIQGRVLIQFLVSKDGQVTDAVVLRGVHDLLDAEALRLVGQMPKWIPGTFEGDPIPMNLVLPVQFALR